MSQIPQQNYQSFKPRKTFVEQLPFWKRYRRATIIGGSILTFCIVYSAPIYYFFRTPPEYVDPRSTMWPGELAQGKTYQQANREKQIRLKKEAEEKRAAEAEAKALKAQAKQ